MKKITLLSLSLTLFALNAQAAPQVFFANLKEGQTIEKGFVAKFGLKGMKIHPAGELADDTGHHHLIVSGTSIPEGQVVPADATHIHFGKGQTEYKLDLTPGDYSLTLQFADGTHKSYGDKMSKTIHVHVK